MSELAAELVFEACQVPWWLWAALFAILFALAGVLVGLFGFIRRDE